MSAGEQSATALGYRWPAEWEPHAATWLTWPHNRETWPKRLEAVERAFSEIVLALSCHEVVRINVSGDAMEEHVRVLLSSRGISATARVEYAKIESDDAWVRDHGPIFVVGRGGDEEGKLAALNFGFNAWGGKYPPWNRDAAMAQTMAKHLGVKAFAESFVLEGGSIDGNGLGAILTTKSCLLNANRNPGPDGSPPSIEEVERRLENSLGAERVHWLADGIVGDDTDGHIDDIARFVASCRIVAAVEHDTGDANHALLKANWEALQELRDDRGQRYELVELPMPPPVIVDGQRCPASYANFYIANEVVLVPTFDVPSDLLALEIMGECLPGREVIPIPSRDLVVGLGSVHCLTQQEPGSRS